eukprot:gene3777-4178_t
MPPAVTHLRSAPALTTSTLATCGHPNLRSAPPLTISTCHLAWRRQGMALGAEGQAVHLHHPNSLAP